MKLGNITSQVFQTFWSENLCNEETYHIMTRIYRTLDDRPALGSHNIEMNIQINKYTVVPPYIAPRYIATLAYRHEIVKNEFPTMLIPPL